MITEYHYAMIKILADVMSAAQGISYSEGNMPVLGKEVVITQFQALPLNHISGRSEECIDESCLGSPHDDRLLQYILSKFQGSDANSYKESHRFQECQSIESYIAHLVFEDGEEIGLALYKTHSDNPHSSK